MAAERGTLGLQVKVNGDANTDKRNPLLTSMVIESVEPESPGALAGISAGDQIVEVAGQRIAGRRASEVIPQMQREVGQAVELTIIKPDGAYFIARLVAVAASK